MSLTANQLTLARMAYDDGVFDCLMNSGTPTGAIPAAHSLMPRRSETLNPLIAAISDAQMHTILSAYQTAKNAQLSQMISKANTVVTNVTNQQTALMALVA